MCWTANQEVLGSNCGLGRNLVRDFCPLANSAMMDTLTMHCHWEDEMVRERTGHSPSYTQAKREVSNIHTHGCPRASLRDCSSYLELALVLLSVFVI